VDADLQSLMDMRQCQDVILQMRQNHQIPPARAAEPTFTIS